MSPVVAIAITAALAAPMVALGQSYSAAVAKQRHCELSGDFGREVFQKNTVMGKTLKEHADDARAGRLPKKALQDIMMIFVSARDKALRSEHDAYMAVWAECMDN